MEVRRHATAPDRVRDALLRRLPAAEMVLATLDQAEIVLEVSANGLVVAVAVGLESRTSLSGAPVVLACTSDSAAGSVAIADAVAPLAVGGGGLEVLGPGRVAEDVTGVLAQRINGVASIVMQQRLFATSAVVVPWQVAGWMRTQRPADHPLVAAWMDAFSVEALGGQPRGVEHWLPQVARAGWDIRLWEVEGEVVGMVNGRRTTPVSSRIGPVYTPPEHRGHGYAAALTAHVARQALRTGDDRVTLFTDVANPTSNELYRRIGFVDVVAHASWVVRPAR